MNAPKFRTGRGFTLLELLVVIAIIAVLASLLFGAVSGMFKSSHGTEDISNMRQVYVAVTLYEQDHGDAAPLDLAYTLNYAKSDLIYNSKIDPRPKDTKVQGWTAAPCGIQPARRVPFRISYPYLRTMMTSYRDRGDNFDYAVQREKPEMGMIANPWVGTVVRFLGGEVNGQSQDSAYGPLMDGPVDRIRMDGSYFRLARRMDPSCLGGCTDDMFFWDGRPKKK